MTWLVFHEYEPGKYYVSKYWNGKEYAIEHTELQAKLTCNKLNRLLGKKLYFSKGFSNV